MDKKVIQRLTIEPYKLAVMEGDGKFACRVKRIDGRTFTVRGEQPLNVVTVFTTDDCETAEGAIAAAKAAASL